MLTIVVLNELIYLCCSNIIIMYYYYNILIIIIVVIIAHLCEFSFFQFNWLNELWSNLVYIYILERPYHNINATVVLLLVSNFLFSDLAINYNKALYFKNNNKIIIIMMATAVGILLSTSYHGSYIVVSFKHVSYMYTLVATEATCDFYLIFLFPIH